MFAASKTGGVVASSGDPYWTSVSLLTNFENNLTFQDGSTNNFPITRNGVVNPSLNTPFSGGVGGSERFNGTTGYLTTASSSTAAGDFTYEAWVYPTTATTGIVLAVGSEVAGRTYMYVTSAQQLGWGVYAVGDYTLGGTVTLNQWSHIAIVRSGTTVKGYVNGTVLGTTTTYSGTTGNANGFAVGATKTGATFFTGFISNTRVVNGTAVYTANFTPPTAPLTAITNTSLLITGTGQGMFNNATFVDQGPNALTVTATGAPVYSGLSPFGNTYAGSVLFNGTSQYLSVPNSAPLQVTNATAFTFECWIYPTTISFARYIFTNYNQSSPYGGYGFGIGCDNFNTQLQFWDGGSWRYFGAITANVWTHIAITYQGSGTTGLVFVNGVQQGSAFTVNSNISYTAGNALIGAQSASAGFFAGYISNLRITKGTAVYTANFTPSTTPLTAITNTSLLVRGDTGAFYDLSNNGLAETGVGSPVVTTQVKKFGSESGSFPGSSNLSIPNNTALNLSSGDWTIEGWAYWTGTNAAASFLDKDGVAASTYPSYQIRINGSGYVVAAVGSGNSTAYYQPLTSSTLLTANTWTFVAFVKSGTTLTLYQAGTNVASATQTGTIIDGSKALLVGYATGQPANVYWSGYMDDIRITKGVARYTANFTPPTATFPTGP